MLLQSIPLTMTALLVCLLVRPVIAADDVIVGNALPPHLRNLNFANRLDGDTIERMVFGADGKTGRKNIEAQLQQKIRELDRRYELTDEIRDRLVLAGRVDKIRLLNSLEDLKQKSSAEGVEGKKWREIQIEAANLRTRVHDLYGVSSFFRKSFKTILANSAQRESGKTGSVATTKDGNIAPLMRAEDLADPNRVKTLVKRRTIVGNREKPEEDNAGGPDVVVPAQVIPLGAGLIIQPQPVQAAPVNAPRIKKLIVRKNDSAKQTNESVVDALAPVNGGGE